MSSFVFKNKFFLSKPFNPVTSRNYSVNHSRKCCVQVTLCRAKLKAKTCHYHNNLESKRSSGEKSTSLPEVTDIEDLVKMGQKTQCCPYYLARDSMNDADILFMPYNYLLDPHTRRAQKIILSVSFVLPLRNRCIRPI